MTKAKDIQVRGNCQICGRQHAVVGSRMAKHGYEVTNGYFQGICGGQWHAPMQISREQTDSNVKFWNEEADEKDALAAEYKAGKRFPETAAEGPWSNAKQVPFSEASEYQQAKAIVDVSFKLERHASFLRSHAKMMKELADRVHGTALIEVAKKEAPAKIMIGEERISENGNKLKVTSIQGARVYWFCEANGRKGWTGSTAWRKFQIAE